MVIGSDVVLAKLSSAMYFDDKQFNETKWKSRDKAGRSEKGEWSLEILEAYKRVTQTRKIEFETEEVSDVDQALPIFL